MICTHDGRTSRRRFKAHSEPLHEGAIHLGFYSRGEHGGDCDRQFRALLQLLINLSQRGKRYLDEGNRLTCIHCQSKVSRHLKMKDYKFLMSVSGETNCVIEYTK